MSQWGTSAMRSALVFVMMMFVVVFAMVLILFGRAALVAAQAYDDHVQAEGQDHCPAEEDP